MEAEKVSEKKMQTAWGVRLHAWAVVGLLTAAGFLIHVSIGVLVSAGFVTYGFHMRSNRRDCAVLQQSGRSKTLRKTHGASDAKVLRELFTEALDGYEESLTSSNRMAWHSTNRRSFYERQIDELVK